jgi:hypothetical protein
VDGDRFRVEAPAIIVLDPQSPHFKAYKGLRYFPPNLDFRYELPLTANPKPETVVIMSTRSNQRQATRVGRFDFGVKGTECPARGHPRRRDGRPLPLNSPLYGRSHRGISWYSPSTREAS